MVECLTSGHNYAYAGAEQRWGMGSGTKSDNANNCHFGNTKETRIRTNARTLPKSILLNLMNRCVREPCVQWCERRTSSLTSGEAVYSIVQSISYADTVYENLFYCLTLLSTSCVNNFSSISLDGGILIRVGMKLIARKLNVITRNVGSNQTNVFPQIP
jgi:hypothetical protein